MQPIPATPMRVDEGPLYEQYTRAQAGKDLSMSTFMLPYLPTLRNLAGLCHHVTEFGLNQGTSALALLAGVRRNGVVVSVDCRWHLCVPGLERLADLAEKRFCFRQANTLRIRIESTDLLFIDTLHTASQLESELARHGDQVRRFLVLHDVGIHWDKGEDGGPGLQGPVERLQRGCWTEIHREDHGCGLLVMERTGWR